MTSHIQIHKHPLGTRITWEYAGMSCEIDTALILTYGHAQDWVESLSREDHENLADPVLRSVDDCYSEELR